MTKLLMIFGMRVLFAFNPNEHTCTCEAENPGQVCYISAEHFYNKNQFIVHMNSRKINAVEYEKGRGKITCRKRK